MSYESTMAFYRQVIVVGYGISTRVFINSADADSFMSEIGVERKECKSVRECIDNMFDNNKTVGWCATNIPSIVWEIRKIKHSICDVDYDNLQAVLHEAFVALVDDEKERVLREGK